MPRRKKHESQKEQSERFLRAVQELVDAGELSPTEAEEKFERAMRHISSTKPPRPSNDQSER